MLELIQTEGSDVNDVSEDDSVVYSPSETSDSEREGEREGPADRRGQAY